MLSLNGSYAQLLDVIFSIPDKWLDNIELKEFIIKTSDKLLYAYELKNIRCRG